MVAVNEFPTDTPAELTAVLEICGRHGVEAAISKVFAVVILGGMRNVPGAIWAAFILGLAASLTAGFISSYYKDVVTFCILIAVLIVKPAGLFGRSQIEKV